MDMAAEPVPVELELVRSFVNTLDAAAGVDGLATPAGLSAWLVAVGLDAGAQAPSVAELRRATVLREALRAHLLANNGQPLADEAAQAVGQQARRSGVVVAFGDGAARVVPAADGIDGALGRILAAVATAMLDGTWVRLKACPARDCGWAFVDRSRNSSRHWCAMGVCGNREKVRAYRARRATA